MSTLWSRTGLVIAAAALAGVVGAAPAAADTAPSTSASAPKYAKNVNTKGSHSNHALGTLQLRYGTYAGRRYIWARIANPTKYANDKWDLTIIADGKDFYEVRKKDIRGTTYTVGFRSQRGVTYIACWSKKGEVLCAKSIKWRV